MPRPAPDQIAAAVRTALERISRDPDVAILEWDPRDFCGACSHSSLALSALLGEFGYRAKFVVGWYDTDPDDAYISGGNHCWVEMPGAKILDVTATQFGIRRRVYSPRSEYARGLYRSIKKGTPGRRFLQRRWEAPAWDDRVVRKIKKTAKAIIGGS